MLTCREIAEFLSGYLESALPAAQVAEFERHLAICPPCQAYLDSYARTVALGRLAFRDPRAPAPADVPEQLVEAIRQARRAGLRRPAEPPAS